MKKKKLKRILKTVMKQSNGIKSVCKKCKFSVSVNGHTYCNKDIVRFCKDFSKKDNCQYTESYIGS